MSREEREEAYNKARERIFGTAATEISTPGTCILLHHIPNFANKPVENEDGMGMSRASSVSVRDKANGVKKGRRRRDSDTFETRSNYVAYAPAYGHSHQPTWVQPQYVSATTQFSGPAQQPYPTPIPPAVYGAPSQPYPPMMPAGGGYGPQYNNMVNVSTLVDFWYISENSTDILLVFSAAWPASVPASDECDAPWALRLSYPASTSTAAWMAAAASTPASAA